MKMIPILSLSLLLQVFFACHTPHKGSIMTVNGKISPEEMELTLHHEHVLVDFIGADSVEPPRYNRQTALEVILPYIKQVRDNGVQTFVECTPATWVAMCPCSGNWPIQLACTSSPTPVTTVQWTTNSSLQK